MSIMIIQQVKMFRIVHFQQSPTFIFIQSIQLDRFYMIEFIQKKTVLSLPAYH